MLMNQRLIFVLFLIFGLSACNLPRENTPVAPPINPDSLASTLEAQSTTQVFPTIPATGTPAPSATITPTYAPPILTFTSNTNCRSGPGETYPIVTTVKAGTAVTIVGRAKEGNFWVVQVPELSAPCWAWGEYATVAGSVQTVPEMTPPPTATPALPVAPRGLTYTFTCGFGNVTVDLSWTDVATNESGYRLLRNGQPVLELPANTTAYTDTASASAGSSFTYVVEAFNSTGKAPSGSITFTCP